MIARSLLWISLFAVSAFAGCVDGSDREFTDAQSAGSSRPQVPGDAALAAEGTHPISPELPPEGAKPADASSTGANEPSTADAGASGSAGGGMAYDGSIGAEPDAGAAPRDAAAQALPQTQIAAQVKTAMIDLKNKQMGAVVLPVPYPVLLFRDGTASLSTRALGDGLDLAVHRSQYPTLWSEWRGEQGNVELRKGMSWVRLRYQGEYPPLARGTVFQGAFSYTSGSYFGISNGLAQRTYWFSSDGTFAVDRSALLVTQSGGAAGVALAPSESGRYEIDGYSITFRYSDGTAASASIVHGAADPGVIYINDAAFLKD